MCGGGPGANTVHRRQRVHDHSDRQQVDEGADARDPTERDKSADGEGQNARHF
jgi:hypothetical protein